LPNTIGTLTEKDAARLYGGTITALPAATHVFTHVVWEMTGFFVRLTDTPSDPDLVFVTPEELVETYPLPSAFRAYKRYCKELPLLC